MSDKRHLQIPAHHRRFLPSAGKAPRPGDGECNQEGDRQRHRGALARGPSCHRNISRVSWSAAAPTAGDAVARSTTVRRSPGTRSTAKGATKGSRSGARGIQITQAQCLRPGGSTQPDVVPGVHAQPELRNLRPLSRTLLSGDGRRRREIAYGAREHGFFRKACNPAAGWEKGKVDRATGYARQAFWSLRQFTLAAPASRYRRVAGKLSAPAASKRNWPTSRPAAHRAQARPPGAAKAQRSALCTGPASETAASSSTWPMAK